jgi:hypothetical protein
LVVYCLVIDSYLEVGVKCTRSDRLLIRD